MEYDFNRVIDRKNTNCLKYDFAVERGLPEDVLPLWVADMDFPAPKEVLLKLQEVVQHGIFGYSDIKEDYFNAVYKWMLKKHNWKTERNWLVTTPGVVFALAAAIRAFTQEGEGVLIQQPVYYPFAEIVNLNKRKLVINCLKYQANKYTIDFLDFENKIKENKVKLFILCSPHNPVGRVWTKEELWRLGEICLKYEVLVVADEIHSDFIYPGYVHHVFASLSSEIADNCIVCTSPSKTFNLAGLQAANIFIPNSEMRKDFIAAVRATGYNELNICGLRACQTAYEFGEKWLGELNAYLLANLQFVRQFIQERLEGVKLLEPEGTYLIWLDFGDLKLDEKELEELIIEKARLWLDAGSIFGEAGVGFQRINIACPRVVLEKALLRLEAALSGK